MIEIERKFLVKDDQYKTQSYTQLRIKQGYIVTNSNGRSVRIRIKADKGYITIKGSSNQAGTSRFEWEKEIPLSEAEQLLTLCNEGMIDKLRYLVKSNKNTYEVDEFYGANAGLVVAEIELESEDQPFDKPDWLGQEVTGDVRYYNAYLSEHPFSMWK